MSRADIGRYIAKKRKALGHTQKESSDHSTVNKSTISQIENGKFTGSLHILEKYLDSIGLELDVKEKQAQLPDWDEIDEMFSEGDE
ncbi:MAG: helix-turn-helix domain-containing protein [Aliivibrio sp.]|uniref:helix-turn-helix domain-containing protein n=1 Tax=Aliivibrio sp. TaxID=1872443 RepID=UPI001A61DB16|nr:helix-turn-helix domain-containing protein [Aliivibrio sp.]